MRSTTSTTSWLRSEQTAQLAQESLPIGVQPISHAPMQPNSLMLGTVSFMKGVCISCQSSTALMDMATACVCTEEAPAWPELRMRMQSVFEQRAAADADRETGDDDRHAG